MVTTYSAVVETGSCSLDRSRWETRADCGHKHRTEASAEACLAKHQRSWCNHGRPAGSPCRHCLGYAKAQSTSALWYSGRIHNADGERVQ